MRVLTRRALLAAATGVTGGVLLGCTPGAVDHPAPQPSGPPALDEPALPRVALRRLWSAPERLAATDVRSAALVEGLLVADCESSDRDLSGVVVVEPASGRVRWTARRTEDVVAKAARGASLFGVSTVVAGSGPAAVVLGTTYRSPCPSGKKDLCHVSETTGTAEIGVVALALADGAVVWTAAVAPAVPRSDLDGRDEDLAVVVAADTAAVVVAVGDSYVINGSHVASDDRRCRTVVLEAATGRQRWVVPDLLPLAVVDDVVLTQRPSGPGPLVGFTEIVALDLGTGRRRWSSADRLEPAILRGSVPGLAVLRTATPSGQVGEQHLLDPAAGEPLAAPLPATASEVLLGTAADGGPAAAWTVTGDRGPVHSLTGADPVPRVGARSPFADTSLIGGRLHRGYLWCHDLGVNRTVAVDRSGHACSDAVGGFLVAAVDDRHLVLLHRGGAPETPAEGFTVYARD